MKRLLVAAVACFAGTPAALAAETDFSSPYDKNPHCAERTTSAMAPECLIQDEGTPRQTYPPAARPGPPNQPRAFWAPCGKRTRATAARRMSGAAELEVANTLARPWARNRGAAIAALVND